MTDIEALQQNNSRAGAPNGEPSGWFWQNPLPAGAPLQAVAPIDSQTAVAVGFEGTILRTNNGGETWTIQPSGTSNFLRGVSFVDANVGVAVGDAADGGVTWTRQSRGTTQPLLAISLVDAQTGTAVGASGTILRTTDGGASWTQQSSGTTAILWGVSFTDADNGTAVGWVTLRTTDGGATWHRQTDLAPLSAVSFVDANVGTAVGAGGAIVHTGTGGE